MKLSSLCVAIVGCVAFSSVLAGNLIILGDNSRGQKQIPVEDGSIVQISAGREHLVGLRPDGTVVAWGYNGNGRATPPPLTNVIEVAAGTYHSLALLGEGKVVSWGFKGEGLTNVPASATNVIEIAAGTFHTLALRSDGSIVGWGYNGQGRLTPPKGLSGVVGIAAGRDHSVALKRNGQVVCWGLNDSNQTNTPTDLDRVIAVAAGDYHTLALRSDGSVSAWGANQDGQCTVPEGLSNVISIAAGHRHSVALRADGSVVAWGNNDFGQTTIPNDVHQIVAIAAGGFETVLLEESGARIESQPESRNILAGRSIQFDVKVIGENLVYQWNFNGQPLADSNGITGSNQASLMIANAESSDAGVYSIDVSNGTAVVRSANALLVVRGLAQLKPPRILADGTMRVSFGDADGEDLGQADADLYQLQWSSDLNEWISLDSVMALEAGLLVANLPSVTNAGARFYRLVARE